MIRTRKLIMIKSQLSDSAIMEAVQNFGESMSDPIRGSWQGLINTMMENKKGHVRRVKSSSLKISLTQMGDKVWETFSESLQNLCIHFLV